MASKQKNKRKTSSKNFSFKSLFGSVFLLILSSMAVLVVIISLFKKDYFNQIFTNKIATFSQKTGFIVEDIVLTTSNDYCPIVTTSLLDELRGKPIFGVSLDDIKDKFAEYDCVHDVHISRRMPNLLKVEVINQEPAAILQNQKRFSFITKTNNIMKIRNSENLDNLIVFTGDKAENHALYLLGIFSVDQDIFLQIDSIMRVGARRWDIRMKNGTEIKLPEKNMEVAWSKFIKLSQESEELKDNKPKVIDLRIEGKAYIHNK